MNREGFLYVLLGALGYVLAFAASFYAISVGYSISIAFGIAAAIIAASEIGAASILRRTIPWRALCVAVTLMLDIFFLYANPPILLQVLRGQAPAWVVPGVFPLFIFNFALTIAAHLLAWRFFGPKASPQ